MHAHGKRNAAHPCVDPSILIRNGTCITFNVRRGASINALYTAFRVMQEFCYLEPEKERKKRARQPHQTHQTMQEQMDLNKNIFRSLNSIHLPPPPGSVQKPVPLVTVTNPSSLTKTPNTPPQSIKRGAQSRNLPRTPLQGSRNALKVLSPDLSSPSALDSTDKPHPPKFELKDGPDSKKPTRKLKPLPQDVVIPLPEQLPPVVDTSTDPTKKPPYSYATLISMAILRSPQRRLTLAQIYSWISSTFRFYVLSEAGWQNSIRHNLSLNKAFTKSERSRDGKGHYWMIEKGYEHQFLKDKCNIVPEGSLHTIPMSLPQLVKPPPPPLAEIKRHASPSKETEKAVKKAKQNTLPALEAPLPAWKSCASANQTLSITEPGADRIAMSHISLFESPGGRYLPQPIFATREAPFTSSFSCNSNFDLSPVKVSDTGPLLEPVTPGSKGIVKTPWRTPNAARTPGSASILRKMYSPGYLDDFYASPMIRRSFYEEDDSMTRPIFGSPSKRRNLSGDWRTPGSSGDKLSNILNE